MDLILYAIWRKLYTQRQCFVTEIGTTKIIYIHPRRIVVISVNIIIQFLRRRNGNNFIMAATVAPAGRVEFNLEINSSRLIINYHRFNG